MGRGKSGKVGSGSTAKISNAGTTATNKPSEQVFRETDTLQSYPSGTQIEVYEDGNWNTYTAHDQARIGRNGRYSRIRRYSIIEPGNKNLPFKTRNTQDSYYIAQKRWRKKK